MRASSTNCQRQTSAAALRDGAPGAGDEVCQLRTPQVSKVLTGHQDQKLLLALLQKQ
jgi:hypothetical protein